MSSCSGFVLFIVAIQNGYISLKPPERDLEGGTGNWGSICSHWIQRWAPGPCVPPGFAGDCRDSPISRSKRIPPSVSISPEPVILANDPCYKQKLQRIYIKCLKDDANVSSGFCAFIKRNIEECN
ncbi:unnamed protein product [Linum tenue]|uniref:Uncharacterized protein n=1 Tax=Linum tenue TaxID=586396 RepID=A0AAV0QVV5_9ROSI|nr:unnamed protein product [Linum tenue]